MAEKIRLEYPNSDILESPIIQLVGWCTTDLADISLSMRVNGELVTHGVVDRPDVRRVFPNASSFGFVHTLAPEVGLCAMRGRIAVQLNLGETRLEKEFGWSQAALDGALEWQRAKSNKRAWCLSVLRCPTCRTERPVLNALGDAVCPGCDVRIPQTSSALNMLPHELYSEFSLTTTGNISSHPYPPSVAKLVEQVRNTGGKTLDCGAGLRTVQDESIINMEIVDYPSTDILAVGQSLPFSDASFDLVLSLAVLEHVDDPFTCASELVRVVKPGGTIFCVVPFLQPEHGYPNHFFNMTRQGLARLFEGHARIVEHEVPAYGAPIHTLCWFLNEYLSNLPPTIRADFERLSIKDVAALKKDQYWTQPYVQQLSTEGNWRLASVTAARLVRDDD